MRFAILVVLLLSRTAPVFAAEPSTPDSLFDADRPLIRALSIIEREYLTEMTREEIVDRALRALLKDLDPYSRYMDPEEWENFDSQLAGGFGGVGVVLGVDSLAQLPRVEKLFIGSAGGAAGVRPGDLILSADGHSLHGLTVDGARAYLIGEPESEVELTIRHRDEESPVSLKIRRKVVKTPSVRGIRRNAAGESEYLYDTDRGIGYIRVSRMAEDTVPEVEKALEVLKKRRMKGLILDLRDSSGGLMRSALGVADLFLDRGRMLANVSRDDTSTYDAKPGGCTDPPMVVLINSGTASSSEFLAAALKDNGRATFLGQRTFGKARIQSKYSLGDGLGGLILTDGKFERPSGRTIDRYDGPPAADSAGVVPDPGMEFVIEGKEYDDWAEDAFTRDGPVVADEATGASTFPDRVLDHAVQVLDRVLREEKNVRPR